MPSQGHVAESPVPQSEYEQTRNVLVILLGWNGADPWALSAYNSVYNNYEDYVERRRNTTDGEHVNVIIKQYIPPSHMTLFNMWRLSKWVIPILRSIQCHRESFGSSSHVIIHSFGTAGTMALCAMNDYIQRHRQPLLYFDGVIYDSPYLAPLPLSNGVRRAWDVMKSKVISPLSCNGCCAPWSYLMTTLIGLLFVLSFPLCLVLFTVYIAATCSMDFVWHHDAKLLCSESPRLLSSPMLLLGSDADHLNPIRKSLPFIDLKIESTERCKERECRRDELMVNVNTSAMCEETTPLKPTLKVISESTSMFSITGYDEEYIRESNGYFEFEKSGHVQHYMTYPQLYQKQVNRFMDFCLKIQRTEL